jgi:UDP-N-acetylmuramoylalanine--D-glutamate ligase
MNHLRDLSVLVLGLGDSGLAMARWCARHGARVRVWDSRDEPPHAALLAAELQQVERLHGALAAESLGDAKLVLKSPGLAPRDERIAPLVDHARAVGIAVQGELDLYARALADLKADRGYAPQILAVTGTNGKTTTTAMTALLVERAGRRVATAGNIGPTLLDTLAQALDDEAVLGHLPEVWVLELSSFQLDAVQGFEPAAAAVLNLTQDHLDWHGTMERYGAAKARIFGTRATIVVNRDDARVMALLPAPPEPKPGRARGPKPQPRHVVRFGSDAPRAPGDYGIVVENGMAWLVRAHPVDDGARRRGPADVAADDELHLQRLMPADALRVRGRHNAANALAALALASAIGCPLAPMLHGLREYHGEPHRVEFVVSFDGIDAYDDSKGTNVGATVAALQGLGADRAPAKLAVILGGDGKGQDFAPLAEPVARHARAVATIGRDAAAIEVALAGCSVPIERHDSLPAATRWACAQARSGDAVLLSPACASLDMFRDYKHRAAVFVDAVRAVAAERTGAVT